MKLSPSGESKYKGLFIDRNLQITIVLKKVILGPSVIHWLIVFSKASCWLNVQAWSLLLWSLYYRHVSTWCRGFCPNSDCLLKIRRVQPLRQREKSCLKLLPWVGTIHNDFVIGRSTSGVRTLAVTGVEQEWADHRAQRTSCWDIQFQTFLVRKVSL